MKIEHPDGKTSIFLQKGIYLMAEIDEDWIGLGSRANVNGILISRKEWNAFMALVNEVNEELSKENG